ncbi:MAG: ornithine carbamoyltransferase [Candidatus Bathyarchaeia archaeon]
MESLFGRDLLTLIDYSRREIEAILDVSKRMKRNPPRRPLEGKSLALLFQKPSTRTRASFEVAANQLGCHPIYLGWGDLQLGRGEPISDTARVLSRYVDCIAARVHEHSMLEELAEFSSVPVVNALSALCHPMQSLADLLTILEKKGRFSGVRLAYVGDGNNVCNSLLVACAKVGVEIGVACPPGYEPNPKFVRAAEEASKESGASILISHEPEEVVRGAHFVYTDVIVSMGYDAEREERLRAFLPKYRVTRELFDMASRDAYFMHDLPCHRGEEVEPEVVDGDRSIIWDQAENRLYTAKAVLYLLLRPNAKRRSR